MAAKVLGPAGLENFRPLNPWGRAMPKPKRVKSRETAKLYQLMVDDRDGKTIPVGPAMTNLRFVEACCEAFSIAMIRGKETTWSNPRVELVSSQSLAAS